MQKNSNNRRPFPNRNRPQREHRINEEISEPQVRLINDDGARVLSTSEALRMARDAGVDLVQIAMNDTTPIVRIIDYGKFKFEKSKKDKEAKKKQKIIQVKEVKIGPKIDTGDFDRKVDNALEFLHEGDNVRVSMRFRGREMAHTDLGVEKMNEFFKRVEKDAILDKPPVMEGRILAMVLRTKGAKKPKSEVSAEPPKEPAG